jgi:hypothetical protein
VIAISPPSKRVVQLQSSECGNRAALRSGSAAEKFCQSPEGTTTYLHCDFLSACSVQHGHDNNDAALDCNRTINHGMRPLITPGALVNDGRALMRTDESAIQSPSTCDIPTMPSTLGIRFDFSSAS